MAIVVIPKEVTRDPNRLVTVLQSYKIERLVLVPTLLKSLLTYLSLKSDSSLLRNLKTWVCSGETLPVSLANEFYDYFAEDEHILCNFYGSTEIMGDVTYFVCKRKKQLELYVNVPIGYPIFNTVIYILDSNKMPVQIGQTGELFVAGLNLADGYVNGRDKDRFIENPLTVNPSKFICLCDGACPMSVYFAEYQFVPQNTHACIELVIMLQLAKEESSSMKAELIRR